MSRGAAHTKKIRDERQEQILNAALRLFATRGLSATKISDIAAEAGVSHGLVLHYFGSKEDIFVAIVEQALQGSVNLMQSALQQTGTPWDRLQSLCETMLQDILIKPEYVLLVIQISVSESIPERARRLLEEYGALSTQYLASLIHEGQDAGQVVAGDPVLLAETFAACIQGLAIGGFHSKTTGDPYLPDGQILLRLLKA